MRVLSIIGLVVAWVLLSAPAHAGWGDDEEIELGVDAKIGTGVGSKSGLLVGADFGFDFLAGSYDDNIVKLSKDEKSFFRAKFSSSVRGHSAVGEDKYEFESGFADLRIPLVINPSIRSNKSKHHKLIGVLNLGGRVEQDRLHEVNLKGFVVEPVWADVEQEIGSGFVCFNMHPAFILGQNEIHDEKKWATLNFEYDACLEDSKRHVRVGGGGRFTSNFAQEDDVSMKDVGGNSRDMFYGEATVLTPKNTEVSVRYSVEGSIERAAVSASDEHTQNNTVFVSFGTRSK